MTFVAPNLACGEARGGSIPRQWGCDRRATKPQAKFGATRRAAGLFAQTSLLAPHRSTVGYARRSRLVWAKNPLPRTPSYLCLRPLSTRPPPQNGATMTDCNMRASCYRFRTVSTLSVFCVQLFGADHGTTVNFIRNF